MSPLDTLTPQERDEAQRLLAELHVSGYADRDRFEDLAPGVRVRHSGERYPEAYLRGTGVVVAVTQRDPSSWSQTWGAADIELIVVWDRPRFKGHSRLVKLGQYHVAAIDQPAAGGES